MDSTINADLEPVASSENRRRFERVSWQCHAHLMQLTAPSEGRVPGLRRALACNIGEGGLQVAADRLFAVRSRVLVELETPGAPAGIQLVGEVVWVEAAGSEGRWLVGIEFADVGDSARDHISGLVTGTLRVH